ncbi:unnamed protein product [Lactuca virosa]|uniref:DNA gyrase subunit A, chloroplastic/mitochondrial n=1 Tax=Lactuca virosa TaxID=75947 RepID=A0AAU9NGH6_9ASTR|nr:unnamed protein product [Lactuca virosa]
MKPSYSLSNNPSMAFTNSFRFFRCYNQLALPISTARLSRQGCSFDTLRFLSTTRRSSRLTSVSSKRRENSATEGVEDGGEGGNGGLMTVAAGSDGESRHGRIVPTELHKEATEAYMSYAMSVLLGRALPDVRDGLKPVHRRILYALHELGLASRKPHKKCARVVGEVLGKFHPHGDTAVYDSLVRMAQDFSLRCPLVSGHGNFGSVDGDNAAAMRYTECRLEALAETMLLSDLDQDTVDFVPNFDSSLKEPSLLPARIPNLLLNGSSGIAVGMATNIPPHNLGELVDALIVLIHNPNATLQELLEYMPGPDFPTGGIIMGNLGILEAYRTGKGRVIVRGKTEIEVSDSRTKSVAIIVKEIPYQTNKSSLVMKIAELIQNKTLEGISDIRDESDRSGMRIVIELKRAATWLVFSMDNLNKWGLIELLKAFLDFRCSVVERRARFKLAQARDRNHIVEGILIGLDNIDNVIDVIRKATSNSVASADLRKKFQLSEKQAEAILDINLRRLTLLERGKYVNEGKSLTDQISNLEELLSSKKQILQVIEQEANEIKNKFSTPRRSTLEDADNGTLDDLDVIPNEEMLLALSEKGYVKRMKPDTFNQQKRGTIGKSVGKLRVNDTMSDFLVCRTHDRLLFFSDKGIVYSAAAYKIPECSRAAAGTPLIQILSLSDGERITSIIPVSDFAEDQYLLMLTANGYVKKVSLMYFSSIRSSGIIALQLVPGDELKWVRHCTNEDYIAMASQNGMVILSSCDIIRALTRHSRGQIAMRLKEGDRMACVDIIPATKQDGIESESESSTPDTPNRAHGPWLLFVSENGYGKRVPLSHFRKSPLNRIGLKGYKFSSEDRLAAVFVVGFTTADDGESDEEVVLVSQSGTVNRIKVRDISIQSRYARGVILMRLEHAGKIQSASLISAAETDVEEEVEVEAAVA